MDRAKHNMTLVSTMLPLPRPYQVADGSLVGHILHIDSFGNLITNIKGTDLPQAKGEVVPVSCLILR